MDCLVWTEPLTLINQLIAGVATGGVYALVALGFVVIYKTSHVLNFAQGDLLMWGAYVACALLSIGLPFPLACIGMLLIAGAGGVTIERLVLRRMVGAPVIAAIIVTLGLSSTLRGLAYIFAGTAVRRFPDDVLPATPLTIGSVVVAPAYVWSLAVAACALIALALFFRFSRLGIALRAAADDQQAAASMGIRISTVLGVSWALAAGVAAVGGVLLGNLTGVNYTLADFGLLIFPVVILGGLNSLAGAIVGGLVMGVLQNVAAGVVDPCVGGGMRTVFPFLALVAILLVKPTGLFGRAQLERA